MVIRCGAIMPSGAQPPGRLIKLFAVTVGKGASMALPVAPELKRTTLGETSACEIPPAVTTPKGSSSGYSRRPPLSPCAMDTRNGFSASST